MKHRLTSIQAEVKSISYQLQRLPRTAQ